MNRIFPGLVLGSLMLAVSACGGSDSSSDSTQSSSASSEASASSAASAANTAVNEAEDAAANEMNSGAEEAKDMVQGAADKVANATQDAADDVSESVENAAASANEAVDTAVASANDTAEAVAASATSAATSAYAALTGDEAKGRRVFAKCMACHTVQEGQNRVGPSLYGIVGREAGSVEGFNYSDANKNSGIVWTEDVLFAYLENPQEYIPGTRMIFPGLPAEQDRADVIAYLKSAAE